MSTRHDPGKVLRHLAATLNVDETLAAFPGMTREALGDILRGKAGRQQERSLGAVLFVDGAARGNPGHAGAGAVLRTAGNVTHRFGAYLGQATNNVAEYRALLLGMEKASELGVRELQVMSDSELIVKQLNGEYKVKSPQLQDLYFATIKACSSFKKVSFTHIPREENKDADRMANLAIDARDNVEL